MAIPNLTQKVVHLALRIYFRGQNRKSCSPNPWHAKLGVFPCCLKPGGCPSYDSGALFHPSMLFLPSAFKLQRLRRGKAS